MCLFLILPCLLGDLLAQKEQLIQYREADGLASNRLNQLLLGPNGLLWIGTDGGGISIFDGVRFVTDLKAGYFIDSLWITPSDLIMVRSEKGISFFDGYSWHKTEEAVELNPITETKTNIDFSKISSLKKYQITSHIESLGQFWITTEKNGLVIFQPLDSTIQELKDAFYNDENHTTEHLTDLTYDQAGNLWITTKLNGLLKYIGPLGPPYQLIQVHRPARIVKIESDASDILIALNEYGELFHKGSLEWNQITNDSLSQNDKIVDFSLSEENGVMALSRSGKIMYSTSIFQPLQLVHQLDLISDAISFKRAGSTFFILTKSGLFETALTVQPGQKIPILKPSKVEVPFGTITDLRQDKLGRMWVLGLQDFGFLKNGKFQKLDTEIDLRNLTCWSEDENGILWIGSRNAGIYKIDLYQSIFEISVLQNPFANPWPDVKNILVFNNRVYLTNQSSIIHLELNGANTKVIGWKNIGRKEGLPNLSFTPKTLMKNRANGIYAGVHNGILQFEGESTFSVEQQVLNPTYFSQITINSIPIEDTEYKNLFDSWYQQKELLKLKPTEKNIDISFSQSGLKGAKSIYYTHRKNKKDQWSPLSAQQSIGLVGLAPGKYSFEAKACYSEDICGEPAELIFQIKAPFYATLWFYIATAGFFAVVFGFWSRSKKIRREKENKEIQKRLILEAKSLELERKALQLQMNPHFIFNAINSIQGEIRPESVTQAKSHLAKFSRLMRRVLESSRVPFVPLDEEIELLQNYTEIAALSTGVKVSLVVDIEESIDPEEFQIPSMMLQPFIENAIQHGFKRRKQGEINLSFRLKGRNLIVRIADDGVGIKFNEAGTHKSISTQVIQERLKLLTRPGSVEVKNNNDGTESGTIVFITLPLEGLGG